MNAQRTEPWPVGTRVVQTWTRSAAFIGSTGTCAAETLPTGATVISCVNGNTFGTTLESQLVSWDDGDEAFAYIAYLRPIDDPDAEPVTTEQDEEIPA